MARIILGPHRLSIPFGFPITTSVSSRRFNLLRDSNRSTLLHAPSHARNPLCNTGISFCSTPRPRPTHQTCSLCSSARQFNYLPSHLVQTCQPTFQVPHVTSPDFLSRGARAADELFSRLRFAFPQHIKPSATRARPDLPPMVACTY